MQPIMWGVTSAIVMLSMIVYANVQLFKLAKILDRKGSDNAYNK